MAAVLDDQRVGQLRPAEADAVGHHLGQRDDHVQLTDGVAQLEEAADVLPDEDEQFLDDPELDT